MKSLFKVGDRGVERSTLINDVRFPTSSDRTP